MLSKAVMGLVIGAWLGFFAWIAVSCFAPTVPPSAPIVSQKPAAVSDIGLIVSQRCAWCHTGAAPAAGIDLSAPEELPLQTRRSVGAGVAVGAAPLIEALPSPERSLLLSWARAAGPFKEPDPPAMVRWNLAETIGSASPGTFPPHCFAFVLEDGFVDRVAWSVSRRGAAPSIRVYQSHRPGTANPSSYLAFGVPWHDLAGDQRIRCRMRTGRWSGITLRVKALHPGDRDERSYTSLRIDRDAIALVSTPTPLETRPPYVEDCCLVGATFTRTDATGAGLYITKDTDLDVDFSVVDTDQGAQYVATVRRVRDGRLLADLRAVSARDRGRRGGFSLWKYGVGGPTEFWDVTWTATLASRPVAASVD